MLPAPPPPPPPAPARKGGLPWMAILLGIFLLASLGVNLILMLAVAAKGGSDSDGEDHLQEVLVDGKSSASDKIVVISVKGVIMDSLERGGGTFDAVKAQLKKAGKDDDVKGILLEVNSPGGGVTESDRIYNALKNFRKDEKLPIVVLFGDVAASGGYYISMASDKIIAHPTTITGSIGVISQFFNVTNLMGKVGVSVETIKSLRFDKAESFKDIGSPYRPMKPAERKLLQDLVTQMWERFTFVVAEGRQGKISAEKVKQLADGRVFTGPQALELKLVDAIGYEEDAYKEIRSLAKSDDAKIVRYRKEPSLADLFSMETRVPQPSVEEMLRKVTYDSPQLLYLWSSH